MEKRVFAFFFGRVADGVIIIVAKNFSNSSVSWLIVWLISLTVSICCWEVRRFGSLDKVFWRFWASLIFTVLFSSCSMISIALSTLLLIERDTSGFFLVNINFAMIVFRCSIFFCSEF